MMAKTAYWPITYEVRLDSDPNARWRNRTQGHGSVAVRSRYSLARYFVLVIISNPAPR